MASRATQLQPRVSITIHEEVDTGFSTQIARLTSLEINDLREVWTGEFRKSAPADFSRDLLVRTLAWRIQENALGGHDKPTIKLLNEYAKGRTDDCIFRRLKSGTVLVREYAGKRHTVTVTSDGFIWQEQVYSNLSVIARAITGTTWNGPRFFGLRERSSKDTQRVEVSK